MEKKNFRTKKEKKKKFFLNANFVYIFSVNISKCSNNTIKKMYINIEFSVDTVAFVY